MLAFLLIYPLLLRLLLPTVQHDLLKYDLLKYIRVL